jgi:hypothetical protein
MLKTLEFVTAAIELLRQIDEHPVISALKIVDETDTDQLAQVREIGHNLLWTGIEATMKGVHVKSHLYFGADPLATGIDIIYDAINDSATIVWDAGDADNIVGNNTCFCAIVAANKFGLEKNKPRALESKAVVMTIVALVEHALGLAERDRIRA